MHVGGAISGATTPLLGIKANESNLTESQQEHYEMLHGKDSHRISRQRQKIRQAHSEQIP